MKAITGKVISNKMKQVAVVEVERFITHPLYHKRMRRTKMYHAQNLVGAKTGDRVSMVECRPISKTVHYKISEINKHGTA